MKINKRLEQVASYIKKDSYVQDVGCDHALLGIYLVKQNKNIKVLATDNKEGPLNQAKKNIKFYKAENIKLKLGSGIEPITPEVDTVVISGMGGLNIIGILKYYPDKLVNVETLILSPNNDVSRVRKEITKLGYYLDDESLVEENKKIYNILKFKKGKSKLKKEEYILGLEKIYKNKLFKKQNSIEIERLNRLLNVLPRKYFLLKQRTKREINTRKKFQ